MSRIVLLDESPTSMVSNPGGAPVNRRCRSWMEGLLANGVTVKISEITDYELRRVLFCHQKKAGIARLDEVIAMTGGLLVVNGATLVRAAELWARARQRGRAMADDTRLDIDVILSAQAVMLTDDKHDVEIATPNHRHLSVFCKARDWYKIKA